MRLRRTIGTGLIGLSCCALTAWSQDIPVELKGCLVTETTVIDRAGDVVIGVNVTRGVTDVHCFACRRGIQQPLQLRRCAGRPDHQRGGRHARFLQVEISARQPGGFGQLLEREGDVRDQEALIRFSISARHCSTGL
jgi:hypothetical protein